MKTTLPWCPSCGHNLFIGSECHNCKYIDRMLEFEKHAAAVILLLLKLGVIPVKVKLGVIPVKDEWHVVSYI
jgi:hypothetical protein